MGDKELDMNKEELKKQLIKIKEDNWNIPDEVNVYELSLKMLENIGSTDPVLRDALIFNMFERIISGNKISHKEMKGILSLCLNENHLFYGVGQVQDDSVFTRTFTLLVIEDILRADNESNEKFLSETEVLNVHRKIMKYCKMEKDYRGYVKDKGWAHSTAHTADVLCDLAESSAISYKELVEILDVIRDKICIDTYTYINEEDERLINTFLCIYNRGIIKDDEIINWLYSFKDVPRTSKYPDEEHLRENRKVFLRSLFFRAKKLNMDYGIISTALEVLNSLPVCY